MIKGNDKSGGDYSIAQLGDPVVLTLSVGFLATHMSFGLSELFGLTDGITTQMVILVALALIYVTSAVTGVHRGIQFLSRMNVFLALAIGAIIFIFGPTLYFTKTL